MRTLTGVYYFFAQHWITHISESFDRNTIKIHTGLDWNVCGNSFSAQDAGHTMSVSTTLERRVSSSKVRGASHPAKRPAVNMTLQLLFRRCWMG